METQIPKGDEQPRENLKLPMRGLVLWLLLLALLLVIFQLLSR
jgi:hypothetical protein